ncbi:MAG: glycosyltransferase [Anaerolineae bacterium]|nr:glycosyltransferase [Anaerolineae bacterium]MDW8173971.1 glycosyltransferase [Anaerolineae bacterium]
MRIVHLIKATQIGGAERHLLWLLPALRRADVDARLLVLIEAGKPMDDLARLAEAEGIPMERLGIARGFDLTLTSRLRDRLRLIQPDLLHTHLIHADLYGRLAALRTPIVITRHNDDAFRHKPALRLLNRWLWAGAKRGIVISQHLRRFAVQVEGAPADKLHVIPYGIRHTPLTQAQIDQRRRALRQELKLDDEALLVGMVGRLTAQKGFGDGLQAFALLARDFPQAHAVIVGDGELYQDLLRQSRGLGLALRAHFLGWRANASELMAAFDVFLMPSRWEGFGLVLLEAMAARLPIVATRSGAIPEVVIDQYNGLLVEPSDHEGMAHALSVLLADRSLRLHMGLVGEDRLETGFSLEAMTQATLAVYRQALGG